MKHIGILAHSFEGATLCFRTACLEGVKRLGPHMHPEITMTCSPMALVLDAWDRGDNEQLRGFFMAGCGEAGGGRLRLLRAARQYGAYRDGEPGRAVPDSRHCTSAKLSPSRRSETAGPRSAFSAPTRR